MGENLSWRLVEELILNVGGGLVERCRNSVGLGVRCHLLGWSPVWAAGIERVQNNVAAFLVVKPLEVFACGIIDDGGLAALPDLAQDLHDELGLADPCVPHDLEVL